MILGTHQLEVSNTNGWKVNRIEMKCLIGSETMFGFLVVLCWDRGNKQESL